MKQSPVNLHKNLKLLRWILPVMFTLGSAIYQLVIARYVNVTFGEDIHWIVEIVFYGTAASLISLLVLTRIKHWLEEKDQILREAQTSERRLAAVSKSSADAIMGIDPQGRIVSWNRGAEFIFGYTAEEIVGQPLIRLFEGQTSAKQEIDWLKESIQREEILREHETRCMRSDGQLILVELTATIISVESDRSIEGYSIVMRDITNRKKREAEIQRLNESLNQQVAERTLELAEKIDELGKANVELQKIDQMRAEFVSLVSHQIRAPLTNMGGAVERMQTDCGLINSTCSRMFSILDQQVSHLDQLVKSVLNVSRIEAGEVSLEFEPVSVMAVIRKMVEQIQARSSERQIQILEKPGLPLAYADRDWLAEVIVNLLDNADKYSPPGKEIIINLGADQTSLTFSVRDHGPGLPTDNHDHLFNKFSRYDSSDSQPAYGYGLGLYLCRLLIEMQSGHIWAENHPHGGAVFYCTLPIWQE